MNPRYYQTAANDAVWQFLAEKPGNPLVVVPTGRDPRASVVGVAVGISVPDAVAVDGELCEEWGWQLSTETECRWQWGKPDKPGLWWHKLTEEFQSFVSVIREPDNVAEQWWSYIGPIPPEPLPPLKKVTQTLYLVPAGWAGIGGGRVYFEHWLSPDDTIPPGAIETVQKREVDL